MDGPIGCWNWFDGRNDQEGAGKEGAVVCRRGEDNDNVDFGDSCGMGFLIDLVHGDFDTHDVRRIHSHERMSLCDVYLFARGLVLSCFQK